MPADLADVCRNMVRQPTVITKEIVTALMREKAARQRGETGLTYAQTLAEAAWEGAILGAREGNASMYNALMDRLEGRVPQPLAHTGADGGAVEVVHTIRPSVSREEWLRERGITVLETATGTATRRA
jgi:hypothetical protein